MSMCRVVWLRAPGRARSIESSLSHGHASAFGRGEAPSWESLSSECASSELGVEVGVPDPYNTWFRG